MKFLPQSAILFLLFISSYSFAQQMTVSGKVVDTQQLPLGFSDVVLLKDNSIETSHALTDSLGVFNLSAVQGDYTLLAIPTD